MTEAELLAEVTALCDRLGLLWFHRTDTPRSSQGTPGFPDLVVLGPGGLIFAELKSNEGQTSADQDRWAWNLHNTFDLNSPWRLWQPTDLHYGWVKEELEALCAKTK